MSTAVLLINWSYDESGTTSPYDFAVIDSAHNGLLEFREIPVERAWEFQDWLIDWGYDNGYRPRVEGDFHREPTEFFAYNIDHRMLMDLQIKWFAPK